MTRNNYSRQRGASWLGFYFSRFLTSRVLRINLFGRTYRLAWTWSFQFDRVKAKEGDSGLDIAPDILREAMRAVEAEEAGTS